MQARERVRRCLDLDHPDRPPRDLWILPGIRQQLGPDAVAAFQRRWPTDFVQCSVGRCPPRRQSGDAYRAGTSTDDWGCRFVNLADGVHGEVKDPLVDDWSHLDRVTPPTELLEVDAAAVRAFYESTDRFVLAGGWARPFERMQFLRGTENLLMDLAEEPPELADLVARVHGFYRRQYEVWAGLAVDALVLMDDWGGQHAMLISPEQWRRLFKPLYAEYVQIAHAGGKKFFMHSDGHIADIYPDLVEIGVDALNSQLFCMDLADLGRRFAGRITFWGEVDRQHVLPFGTPADVDAAVGRVVEHLWRPAGGVIAQFEWGQNTPVENASAVFEAWDRRTSPAGRSTGGG